MRESAGGGLPRPVSASALSSQAGGGARPLFGVADVTASSSSSTTLSALFSTTWADGGADGAAEDYGGTIPAKVRSAV